MNTVDIFIPKIITVFREGYSWQKFYRDCLAGFVVGIVALPLSIAFAIASGVSPQRGLYTAIIGGFLISALSGSRVQIGGPTGAFIVIVYNIVQLHGYEGLAVATLMAGFILVIMGLARFGRVIEFIPYPMTIGFTSGIAVIIFTSQLRDFFGLSIDSLPADFVEKLMAIAGHMTTFNPWALLTGCFSVFVILQVPKFIKRIPGSIFAIVLTTVFVSCFHIPIETVAMRFGEIPGAFPKPAFPAISWNMIRTLMMPAMTIAFLAGIESLLSAVVADGMTGYRHRSNMELIAQGAANIGSVFFGGIPATGAIARTATNIKNGGRTPVAGLVHAVTLLFILMVFGKWAGLIPIATLAGVLLVVAFHMSEWRMFLRLFRSPKSDIIVMLTTFLLTVFVDLTVAIQVGFVLAAFLFMKRMVDIAQVESITQMVFGDEEEEEVNGGQGPKTPEGIEVFEIKGPFFFGAAAKFKTVFDNIEKDIRVLILSMRHVPTMDATGLRALEDIFGKNKRGGVIILLAGVGPSVRILIEKSGFSGLIGPENILPDIQGALSRAKGLLQARNFPPKDRPRTP